MQKNKWGPPPVLNNENALLALLTDGKGKLLTMNILDHTNNKKHTQASVGSFNQWLEIDRVWNTEKGTVQKLKRPTPLLIFLLSNGDKMIWLAYLCGCVLLCLYASIYQNEYLFVQVDAFYNGWMWKIEWMLFSGCKNKWIFNAICSFSRKVARVCLIWFHCGWLQCILEFILINAIICER